jgi:hypothetical protein
MAAFIKFTSFLQALAEGKHNFASDQVKLAFFNTAPNASDATIDFSGSRGVLNSSGSEEIQSSGGYVKGGVSAIQASSGISANEYSYAINPVTFAPSGDIEPFQYVVAYNASSGSASARPIIGMYAIGRLMSLYAGDTFVIRADNNLLFKIK